MALKRIFEREKWRRLYPGVWAHPKATGPEVPLLAASLWAGDGAIVSHRPAAHFHELDRFEGAKPELIVPLTRAPRSSRSVIIHRSNLPLEDVRKVGRIHVTTIARTLVDLASVVSLMTLAIAVEHAWSRKLFELKELELRAGELAKSGRKGTANLRRVLEDCRSRGKPLESPLEVRVWWTIKNAGLPLPVPGTVFKDEEGRPGRIDFAYQREGLAIEADGAAFHGLERYEPDRVRLSRLAALGWRVIHVTWRQLRTPKAVVDRIARALKKRRPTRAQLPPKWSFRP